MSEKLDRQGARTEFQYNKRFAELMGIATDARDKVDKVASTLRNEFKEQYTQIYRDTEKIILSALENYTKTGDFETYKRTVESELLVMADRITATVESTEESIKEVQDILTNTYEEFRRETESEFQVLTDQITASVTTSEEKIKEVRDSLTDQTLSFEQYKKDTDSSLKVLSDGIAANVKVTEEGLKQVNDELTGQATEFEQFKTSNTAALNVLSEGISANVAAIEDRTKRINNLDSQVTSLETFQREASAELNVLAGGITANATELTNQSAQINDISGHVESLEQFQSEATSELSLLPGEFATTLAAATKLVTDAKTELGNSIQEVDTYAKSTLKQDIDSLTFEFEKTTATVGNIDGDVQKIKEELEKHFEFSADGLIIKAGENAMQLRLDNDIIRFMRNGQEFGWWDGVNFHTGNIYVAVDEVAQFGNYGFLPYEDADTDGLDLARVGD